MPPEDEAYGERRAHYEAKSETFRKMLAGELYHAFEDEMIEARARCKRAVVKFNKADGVSRRELTEMWRDIIQDSTPLPPPAASAEEDDKLFEDEPWVEPPMQVDYGFNIVLGKNVFINFHSCFLDTCSIKIGSRTLVGPHVNFYSGTHPLDPNVRNGTRGPELGKPIVIGEDCWLGGNVTILPGVTIGDGAVVGAGSVVTKDVPAFHVAAGNPARVIRKIETQSDPSQKKPADEDKTQGAEVPMADVAR